MEHLVELFLRGCAVCRSPRTSFCSSRSASLEIKRNQVKKYEVQPLHPVQKRQLIYQLFFYVNSIEKRNSWVHMMYIQVTNIPKELGRESNKSGRNSSLSLHNTCITMITNTNMPPRKYIHISPKKNQKTKIYDADKITSHFQQSSQIQ